MRYVTHLTPGKEREQRAAAVLLRHMDGEQAELILEELVDERVI